MEYRFGAARELYERRVHPRVLIGSAGLVDLRRRTRRGEGARLLAAVRAKLRPYVAELLAAPDPRAAVTTPKADPYHSRAWLYTLALPEIALVGALDEDADAIAAARRVLLLDDDRLRHTSRFATTYDFVAAHLTPAERRDYATSAVRVAREYAAKADRHYFKNPGGNGVIGHMSVPLMLLLSVRGDEGVPDLTRDLAGLVRRYEATLHTALGPDGYPEEDIGYGSDVAAHLHLLGEALRRAGLYDGFAQCPRLARVGEALLHFVQPWGEHLAHTGDFARNHFFYREFILPRLATETGNPALLWLNGTLAYQRAAEVRTGQHEFYEEVALRRGWRVPRTWLSLLALPDLGRAVPPTRARTPTAYCDRGRGLVSFRSGWRADDTFVYFDASQRSPAAQGHAHASATHFSLSALGEYFAIQSARYAMDQDQHNVVLVDGRSGRDSAGQWNYAKHAGHLLACHPGRFVDSAMADASAQSDCYWARRTLGLVKGPGADASGYVWTLDDINKANDRREFWWQLHTSPENTITLHRTHATVTGWRCGNHLDVQVIVPAAGEYPDPHTVAWAAGEVTVGSYAYIKNPHERARDYERPAAMVNGIPFVRPRLVAQVTGWNGRLVTLLLPRRHGTRPARVQRLPTVQGALAVRVTFAAVVDTLIFGYEHHVLEADGVCARGRWCVVRRARADGRVLAATVAEGRRLEVDGRAVRGPGVLC